MVNLFSLLISTQDAKYKAPNAFNTDTLNEYRDVFCALGQFLGYYKIQVDKTIKLIVHAVYKCLLAI